jgi:hypothetical protein
LRKRLENLCPHPEETLHTIASFWEWVAPSTAITHWSLLRSWVFNLKEVRNLLPSWGDSKFPNTPKSEGNLKENMAARGTGWTGEKGGTGGDLIRREMVKAEKAGFKGTAEFSV